MATNACWRIAPFSHLRQRHWSIWGSVLSEPFVPSSQNISNSTTTKMCFGDQDTYTTRMRVRKGERYSEEYSQPRYGMSWRRRNGLGGSYYPSNYYRRRPSGRYMSGAITHNRYSSYGGQAQRYGYEHRGYGYGQQGYGYGRQGYPQQIGYPRGVVPGGYIGQSSGYGRYYPDNRVAMPHHGAMVSLLSFLLSPIAPPLRLPSCTPPPLPHWLAWHFNRASGF